ncbi:MAG: hypothetical protein ACK53Y_23675, partial [bacterium]
IHTNHPSLLWSSPIISRLIKIILLINCKCNIGTPKKNNMRKFFTSLIVNSLGGNNMIKVPL